MKKFILLILLNSFLFAQDSLYLVNTLTGDSINKIINAKGAGDINGDGYADLVVSYSDSVKIFLGNERFELQPAYSYGNNNGFVLCPGDVNNDGCADLLIGQKKYPTGYYNHISTINLLFGGRTGLDSCNTFSYNVNLFDQVFSRQVEPLGDVNGDGYNDFAISAPYNWTNGISYVYVYLGGDTIKNEPFVTFVELISVDTFGSDVTGIGDVNNDGYDDILIGDPGYADTVGAESSGRVCLYYGGADMDSIADSILTFKDIQFGSNVKKLGDINNDGSTDFAVTSYDSCVIYFSFDRILTTRFYGSGIGHGIGGNGDVNNDGIMDLILGDPSYKDNTNFIGIFDVFIGNNNFSFNPDLINIGEQYGSLFSQYTDFIGDFNGDGYDDIFVLAATFRKNEQEIGKLYIYSIQKLNSIKEVKNNVINGFQLYPNFPNPFNNSTIISFLLNSASKIKIDIYDINGRLIKTLFSGKKSAGLYKIIWDGKTDLATEAASGVYFVVMKKNNTNSDIYSRKIVLLK